MVTQVKPSDSFWVCMMKDYQHIDWRNLKAFRKRVLNPKTGKPFKQKEIEEETGIKQSYLSRLERGDYRSVDRDVVNKLAAAYRLKPSQFCLYLESETNKLVQDVKITHSNEPLPIKCFNQQYHPKGFPYSDGVLKDNPQFIDCPPVLRNVQDAYALFMPDHNMEPRYRQNDILYVNPEIFPTRGDDVVVELKYKDKAIMIVREVIDMQNVAPENSEEEIPSYNVISLADKESLMHANYPMDENLRSMGSMHNPWALLLSNSEIFTISGYGADPETGDALTVDVHPIVGTQRARYADRKHLTIAPENVVASKVEMGQPTMTVHRGDAE